MANLPRNVPYRRRRDWWIAFSFPSFRWRSLSARIGNRWRASFLPDHFEGFQKMCLMRTENPCAVACLVLWFYPENKLFETNFIKNIIAKRKTQEQSGSTKNPQKKNDNLRFILLHCVCKNPYTVVIQIISTVQSSLAVGLFYLIESQTWWIN